MFKNGLRRNVWKSNRREVGLKVYPPVCLDILKRFLVSAVPITRESTIMLALNINQQTASGVAEDLLSIPSVSAMTRSLVFGWLILKALNISLAFINASQSEV